MDTLIVFLVTVLLTVFAIILIPVYKKYYGYQNFFWISDIGLFLTVIALWFHSSLLISTLSILVLPFELLWMFDFVYRLIMRKKLFGIVDYMFTDHYPISVRLLTLFHIVTPVIWIWCLSMWEYDELAFPYAILLTWVVVLLTYFFTDPQRNINWVFSPSVYQWKRMPQSLWLLILFVGVPLCIIIPLHLLFLQLF